jgi:murein DD-endopeptidase MepM/ murein hydrolase activator NlpD
MDSIIASQKIGKRKSVSALAPRRATDRRSYPALFLNGSGEAPRRSDGVKIARRRSHAIPKGGFRPGKPRDSAVRAILQGAARLAGALGIRILSPLRALYKRASGASRLGLAAAGAAGLAALVALALGTAALLRGPSFPMPAGALLPETDPTPDALLEYASPELADGAADSATEASNLPPIPVTLSITTYTVRSSDSLASISKRFGLNTDTLISVNGLSSSRSIRSGAQIRVPNINGLIYKVRSGDSLASVAGRYKIEKTRIVDANDLGSAQLKVGQSLFIPGARLPQSVIRQALGQLVAWPARGPLSSYFGYRPDPFTGVRRFHAGIDIVMNSGTPVRAAMSGRVSNTGYNANYGNYVILSHADGYQTLYGHLTSILAQEGAPVDQSTVIGLSGNTGYSTGPHLHFGLFRRSLALNPLKFLK